jgi:hypothetical protein
MRVEMLMNLLPRKLERPAERADEIAEEADDSHRKKAVAVMEEVATCNHIFPFQILKNDFSFLPLSREFSLSRLHSFGEVFILVHMIKKAQTLTKKYESSFNPTLLTEAESSFKALPHRTVEWLGGVNHDNLRMAWWCKSRQPRSSNW